MAKPRPGLPADFQLSVAPDEPVQLDDYIDRELAPSRPATPKSQKSETTPPPAAEKAVRFPREKARSTATTQTRSARARDIRRPPRMELSLDAETQRKAQDVVDDVCQQGPQADATASEFVRGLVQLAHDVRHKADYSHLNRRGQWGSATARAFVADLKEAFLRAIGEYYIDRFPLEARQQLQDASTHPDEARQAGTLADA